MEAGQFETLMLAITGLKTELKSEITGLRTEMRTGFTEIRQDLKSIREQVAKTHVEVTDLKTRVSKLEGPRA